MGLKRYYSVLGVKSRIYLLDSIGKITTEDKSMDILYDSLMSSFEEKSGFIVPKDIENITEEEFESVKKSNLRHLNNLLIAIFIHLSR